MILIFTESVVAANRYINMTLTYDYAKHKYNAEEVFVAIDGKKLTKLQMPPIILNNYTLVPAREVFEAMGAKVDWNRDVEQVIVTSGSNLVVIPIDSNKAYVNGIASLMQTKAKIINNKTMIPLRFVSDALGYETEWDKDTRVANIIISDETTQETTSEETTTVETTTITITEATTVETTTEITTVTTTETTTKVTVTLEPAEINSITLKTANGRDTISIEGNRAVEADAVMSNDGKALNITIPEAKFIGDKGKIAKGTYVKSGIYYNHNNSVNINLDVLVNVGIKTVNYGSKTVITIDYEPELKITGTGYDEQTGEFVLKNAASVSINTIVHNDDYNNLTYTMTLPGNFTASLTSDIYDIDSDYLDSIIVDVGYSFTTITFNENRILAYNITKSGSDLKIKPVLPKEKYNKIIVLDAGHGGQDPGASGQGLVEKDLTLSMLLEAKKLFDNDGSIKCYATRLTDMYPSFDDRTNLANEVGDAFVSIHINAASSASASGTETYSLYANDQGNGLTSYRLAESILSNLLNNLNTVNRKVKSENWIVLRQSEVPATLIEIGFITNEGDASKMRTQGGKEAVGRAIYDSVKALFNQYPPVR